MSIFTTHAHKKKCAQSQTWKKRKKGKKKRSANATDFVIQSIFYLILLYAFLSMTEQENMEE